MFKIPLFLNYSHPDDDCAKNEACQPHDAPNFPWDWFKFLCISQINTDKLYSFLGQKWMEESRLSIMSHMTADQLEKMKSFKNDHQGTFIKNLKEFGNQKEIYGTSQAGHKKAVAGG